MGSAVATPADKIDPEDHQVVAKETGTLIFFDKSNALKPPDASEDLFFGLDVDFSELEINDQIGKGTYGAVSRGKYQGHRIAVKKLFLPDDPEEKEETLEDFAKEIKILSILKHECIVHFLGACREVPNLCVLLELCEGSVGSLLEMVRKQKVQVTWRMCLRIAKDCARACDYLHKLTPKILHRDLKAENLLLDANFKCKLTDFGLSRGYENKSVMTVCGTACWVAPEIFRGEAYTEKIDSYSFGVVLWELFCFEKPYMDQDGVELPYLVAKKGLRPPRLEHCPQALNKLMSDCWHGDMNRRPAFEDIIVRIDTLMKEGEDGGYITDAIAITKPAPDTPQYKELN